MNVGQNNPPPGFQMHILLEKSSLLFLRMGVHYIFLVSFSQKHKFSSWMAFF